MGCGAPKAFKYVLHNFCAIGAVSESLADAAGAAAVANATPLSGNEYKVQLAKTAVKRAILRAAGLETGGL